MARATGVQVAGTVVRVADLDGSPKSLKLRGYAEVAIDPAEERITAITKALREAFKTSKASREHIILGVPVRDCVIREITIPFTDPDQIKKVIKFESEPHLHSCSIDDVVVCFHKVEEVGNRSTVLVLAARKEKISEALIALERSGADPLAIDIDAAGLHGASTNMAALSDKDTYLVCDIGYTSTLVTLTTPDGLRVIRSVRMGMDSITSRVSKDLDIGRDEARERTQSIMIQDLEQADDLVVTAGDVLEMKEETTKSSAELERDIIRQRQAELVNRLEQEIYRSVNNVNLEEPLECIYICGPGSLLPRLTDELSEKMSTPVYRLELLDEYDHKIAVDEQPVVNAGLPVPAGLALKHVGVDPLALDFRQEEFVFTKKFDKLKVALLCLFLLCTAVNVCWFALESVLGQMYQQTEKQVAQRASEQFSRIVDENKMSPEDLKYADITAKELKTYKSNVASREGLDRINYIGVTMKKLSGDLRKAYEIGGGSDGPKQASDFKSALDRLEAVCKAIMNTGIKDYAMGALRVKVSEVRMTLTLPEIFEHNGRKIGIQEQAGLIEEQLKKIDGFTKMVYVNYNKREDGRGFDFPGFTVEFEKEGN